MLESCSVTTRPVCTARPAASVSHTSTIFRPFRYEGVHSEFRVGVSLIASGRVIARALRNFVAASHAVRLLKESKAMASPRLAKPLADSVGLGPV